jgi:amino-acid N-acetyltransferase
VPDAHGADRVDENAGRFRTLDRLEAGAPEGLPRREGAPPEPCGPLNPLPGPVHPRKRLPADQAQVLRLLAAAGLPPDGLERTEGWVLEAGGVVIGHVAVEPTPEALVLRSLVVDEAHRGRGLAEILVTEAEAAVAGRVLVLKTETVGPWMERRGYRRVTLDQVPAGVRATTQFSGSLCSGTPVYLKEAAAEDRRSPAPEPARPGPQGRRAKA